MNRLSSRKLLCAAAAAEPIHWTNEQSLSIRVAARVGTCICILYIVWSVLYIYIVRTGVPHRTKKIDDVSAKVHVEVHVDLAHQHRQYVRRIWHQPTSSFAMRQSEPARHNQHNENLPTYAPFIYFHVWPIDERTVF